MTVRSCFAAMNQTAMTTLRATRLSLLFVFIGFIGGAVRYWRWWPSQTKPYFIASGILCPLCPNIDGVGTNWDKFVSRTVLGGLLNIVPALLVGWLVVGILAIRSRKHFNVEKSPFHQRGVQFRPEFVWPSPV